MQIRKNIYQITGGMWGYLGNAYIVKYSEGYVMIDTGSPNALDSILENLNYWDIDPNKITHLLLTHGHDDHLGGAKYFKEELGAKIIIGKEDVRMLEEGNLGEDSPCINHTMPPTTADILISEDCFLEIGNLVFTVITTPGHTNGSLVYLIHLDNESILFPGDTFYVEGNQGELILSGWKGDLTYDSKKLGESLKKIYTPRYKITLTLAGHGIPRFGPDSIQEAYASYLKNDR
ncbi:MBL fold metallo-hydrolase [Tetragenococcus solitarius]|uniref:beta-lactamase n=1 Tax=Tetragenococcus solitarius TaxID=71453 RepID=A0ABP6KQT3_9ENTE|nr:MBL fold metallo-hydrolase [Tetragenococcus solitarius]